jgi:hypothetical protein
MPENCFRRFEIRSSTLEVSLFKDEIAAETEFFAVPMLEDLLATAPFTFR